MKIERLRLAIKRKIIIIFILIILNIVISIVNNSFRTKGTIVKSKERTKCNQETTKIPYNNYWYKNEKASKKKVTITQVGTSADSLKAGEKNEDNLAKEKVSAENVETAENSPTTESAPVAENSPTTESAPVAENVATPEPLSFEKIEQNCSNGGEFTEEYKQFINSTIPNGGVLNRYDGTLVNQWGNKETYYNLPMSGVVRIMRTYGYSESSYPYWVRADGAKMLGPYIMVAANLKTYHRCTVVNISLGKAIVADTGDFAYQNVYQFDVATSW